MDCPVCTGTKLVMSERQGIEIDYCPGCRGVWLDRGELDKIIERSTQAGAQATSQPSQRHVPSHQSQESGYSQQHPNYKKKKREGFLSDLFDFD